MTTEAGLRPSVNSGPTLAQQVTKLYDLIAGYHAAHLIEIARELGVWEAVTRRTGVTSAELAAELRTDPFYTDVLCRTAFAFELLERHGDGWTMARHFDQILGDPEATFYLGRAARIHMVVGRDYSEYARRVREGSRTSFQEHGEDFIREIADGLKALPRIFLDLVVPKLPGVRARLEAGARVTQLASSCGTPWPVREKAG